VLQPNNTVQVSPEFLRRPCRFCRASRRTCCRIEHQVQQNPARMSVPISPGSNKQGVENRGANALRAHSLMYVLTLHLRERRQK
jgi:hypothetical protein